MRHVLIEDGNAGDLSVSIDGGPSGNAGAGRPPALELSRSGTDELLLAGRDRGFAHSAESYERVLSNWLQSAVGSDELFNTPLLVEVRCGAAGQSLLWEALRLHGNHLRSVVVVRTTTASTSVRNGPPDDAELLWLAARAPSDAISRYCIAGPVLARVWDGHGCDILAGM